MCCLLNLLDSCCLILWQVCTRMTQMDVVIQQLDLDYTNEPFYFIGSQSRFITAYVCAACVILLAFYHLFKELVWFYCNIKTYLFDVQNYIELVLYMTALVFVSFVFVNHCGCPEKWQWQVGIASVFLGWLNLIFQAYHIPMISIYVIMFRDIFITFTKLIMFALLLISAFSLLLFMMFHNPTSTAKVRRVSLSYVDERALAVGVVLEDRTQCRVLKIINGKAKTHV